MRSFQKILECRKTLPPVRTAFVLYDCQSAEHLKPFFDVQHKFPLKDIPGYPIISLSSSTGILSLCVKGAHTFLFITDIDICGLSPGESVFLAYLFKRLDISFAFVVVLTGLAPLFTFRCGE